MKIDEQNLAVNESQDFTSPFLIKFGKSVQQCRQDNGVSHKALSDITGIKSEDLTLIELGQQDITLEDLSVIAFALGVEARTLVD